MLNTNEEFRPWLYENSWICDPIQVHQRHETRCKNIVTDPYSGGIADWITDRLSSRESGSVIRLGDGEATIMSMVDLRLQHSRLAEESVRSTLKQHGSKHRLSIVDIRKLSEALWDVITHADVIGLLGLSRRKRVTPEDLLVKFDHNPRGIFGHCWNIHTMAEFSEQRASDSRIIASAHLYLSVLTHFDKILAAAPRVVCVTNRLQACRTIRELFPSVSVEHRGLDAIEAASSADEVFHAVNALASEGDPSYGLMLIGAGPWAEYICRSAKRFGFVAVDVGSAFDVIAGELSRPVHRTLGLDVRQIARQWKHIDGMNAGE